MTNDTMIMLINHYASSVQYKRFNYCQAYISEPIYNSAFDVSFYLVKSYNTIVGFVNYDTKEYIELGKWSRTTSKQVSQIYNQVFSNKGYTRKFIDLYN